MIENLLWHWTLLKGFVNNNIFFDGDFTDGALLCENIMVVWFHASAKFRWWAMNFKIEFVFASKNPKLCNIVQAYVVFWDWKNKRKSRKGCCLRSDLVLTRLKRIGSKIAQEADSKIQNTSKTQNTSYTQNTSNTQNTSYTKNTCKTQILL